MASSAEYRQYLSVIDQYYLYSPDDPVVVRNIYIKSCLCFIVYLKFYLQCLTFHHHPRQSNI